MSRPDDTAAANEFDRWAAAGRAESMAAGHRGMTEAAVAHWKLEPNNTVLDVGCGNGWAVRWLVEHGAGRGLGVDISPQMIARACEATDGDPRFDFRVASAQTLPFDDGLVSHVLSVESLYYYPDPAAALAEWARVTASGGWLVVAIELYAENPASHGWVDALDVSVHLLNTATLVEIATAGGWTDVRWQQVRDPRPIPSEDQFSPSEFWPSYAMLRAHHHAGALVITGRR